MKISHFEASAEISTIVLNNKWARLIWRLSITPVNQMNGENMEFSSHVISWNANLQNAVW
jgi:hypothetical protein